MLLHHHITLIATILLSSTIIAALVLYPLLTMRRELDVENDITEHILEVDDKVTSSFNMVNREEWLAQPPANELVKLHQPVPWVIITHTATESCQTQTECIQRVRTIQKFHQESRSWDDIGYNFLVAEDGSVYFGRGWDYIGTSTDDYNKYSLGIGFIGTYNNVSPSINQTEACQKLLKLSVKIGKLSKDYKLFAHRQLTKNFSPGDKVYDVIKNWPHFVVNTTNITDMIPKD